MTQPTRTDRFRKWIRELRTTDLRQARRQLRVGNGVPEGFCCLGIGYRRMPGYSEDILRINSLPPAQWYDWLGVPVNEFSRRSVKHGLDLYIDWPAPLTQRPNDHGWSGPYLSASLGTAATLNDQGFTFRQIADILDYFGVKEAR
jgi:hypothetical protein